MDRIDYYKNNVEPMPFPFMPGKVNFNMSLMKPLLTEWSTFVMALEKLIRYGSECDDKECAGCVFIKRLIERLGLDNLPEATQALYRKIFLPN
jgi:hypothetical protein